MDSQEKALVNTDIIFNINGVFYTRTTNATGWARLNINLKEWEYIFTAYNPVTGEEHAKYHNCIFFNWIKWFN